MLIRVYVSPSLLLYPPNIKNNHTSCVSLFPVSKYCPCLSTHTHNWIVFRFLINFWWPDDKSRAKKFWKKQNKNFCPMIDFGDCAIIQKIEFVIWINIIDLYYYVWNSCNNLFFFLNLKFPPERKEKLKNSQFKKWRVVSIFVNRE
jgi:hypothetical protein